MNDDLLKNAGGGNYFQELLERIRDIRSSEKVFYRQITHFNNKGFTLVELMVAMKILPCVWEMEKYLDVAEKA